MGEPLNNYEEVLGAVQAMIDPQRFGLSPGHITVSTVGVIPNIIRVRCLPRVLAGLASRPVGRVVVVSLLVCAVCMFDIFVASDCI